MNIDDSHLLKHSQDAKDASRAQLTNSYSFARNFRSDVHSRQPRGSPFSRLGAASSNYNNQIPKPFNTQSHQFSGNINRHSGHGTAKPFSLRTSGHEYTQDKRFLAQSNSSTNQDFHFLRPFASGALLSANNERQLNATGPPCSELGEDKGDEEFINRDYYPLGSPQKLQQLLKKEVDKSSPSVRNHTGTRFETHDNSRTAVTLESNSSYDRDPLQQHESLMDGSSKFTVKNSDLNILENSRENSVRASLSRSSSVALLNTLEPTDDLSTLMFKGATDLRNAKLALEEQTKQIQKLQCELDAVTTERNGLRQRVNLVKKNAKEGLESTAEKLGNMNMLLQSLKSQSQDCFSSIENAQESMVDIKDLRAVVKKSTEQLELLSGSNGIYSPTEEWKAVLAELQNDISNKQQVIDLFRDRLEVAQGELADAKNRSTELDNIQLLHSNALRLSSERLVDAVEKLTESAAQLKKQQKENIDILVKNADLETKLSARDDEISALKQCLSKKDNEFLAFNSSQDELRGLRGLIKDREEQLASLQEVKERYMVTAALFEDRERKIEALESSVEEKSRSLEASQKSLLQAEIQFSNECLVSKRLENDLAESRAQVKSEFAFRSKITSEKENLKISEETLINEVNNLKMEAEDYKIKLRQSDTQLKMLQERYDDQSLMLRMEKKAQGDIQECLLATEAAFTRTIEDNKQTFGLQIDQLKEQVKSFEAKMQDSQNAAFAVSQEYAEKLSDLERKHTQQIHEMNELSASKANGMAQVQNDLVDATVEVQSLHKRIQSLQQETSDLHEELAGSKLLSKTHLQELVVLRRRIEELQKSGDLLSQRMRTIVSRYESGDLSVEEKQLIDTVHRASQASHEQRLVAKGNEIRQRDNTIKALEKRKSELESQLARVLNMQAKAKAGADPVDESRSLIDPGGWMSSQSSSSPLLNKMKAPDRDGPSTMMDVGTFTDNSTTNSRTLVTNNQVPMLSFPNVVMHPELTTQTTQVSPPAAPSFGKLDTKSPDGSDDSIPGTKRKLDTAISVVEHFNDIRPLRRTRTTSRGAQRVSDEVAEEKSAKMSAHAPKVKARKRR